MNNDFISIALLAYKRPDMLMQCIDSIHQTTDYPFELICNVDGEDNPDQHAASIAHGYLREKKISKLISIGGLNRGVGRSFQNCIGVSEGRIIVKCDTDLIFKPKWASTLVSILDNNSDIGAVSLFNYNNYDPKDERFKILQERSDALIVSDFVSSVYGFCRNDLAWCSLVDDPLPDDGVHQQMNGNKKLAITKEDMVINNGFGLGRSVYVVADMRGNPVPAKIHDTPLLFHH